MTNQPINQSISHTWAYLQHFIIWLMIIAYSWLFAFITLSMESMNKIYYCHTANQSSNKPIHPFTYSTKQISPNDQKSYLGNRTASWPGQCHPGWGVLVGRSQATVRAWLRESGAGRSCRRTCRARTCCERSAWCWRSRTSCPASSPPTMRACWSCTPGLERKEKTGR